jgi:hypothetical protein
VRARAERWEGVLKEKPDDAISIEFAQRHSSLHLTPKLTCERVQQKASAASFPRSLGILPQFR